MKNAAAARALLALLIVLPQPLAPATITVDGQTGDPPGTCDLVEAIQNANNDANTNADCPGDGAYGDDIIELTEDVTLTAAYSSGAGLPLVTSTIEIQGNDFTVRRDPGAPDFGIFHIDGFAPGDLTLQNTTVSGGRRTSGLGGGGILVDGPSGKLHLNSSVLSGNSAVGGGGGVLINGATATLTNCTLVENTATGDGGGIMLFGLGKATVTNSTLAENSANRGGGISNFISSTATLINSTLSGNSATYGGGIYNYDSNLTLTNSTLSGNSATKGGGIYNGYGSGATLTNSTLAGNSASGLGGGIYSYVGYDSASTRLGNSLLANSASGGNCYPEGAITDNLNNLADDATCGMIPDTLTGLDPTLADNGGPTMTHALLDGSNAIDNAGTPFSPDLRSTVGPDPCSLTDQRGAGREGDCDSGAFEFLACADLVLDVENVTDTQTRTNCQNIVVGPNFTVAGTGDLTLRAGRSIEIGNGTSVETNGTLTLGLDGDLQIGNTVFVTSTTYLGDLGGPAGADAECNERAAAAGLSGSFKAWLSSMAPAVWPAQTFTLSNAPYVRVDGVRIADDWDDLTDGNLLAPINVDEFGNSATVGPWTATLIDGITNTPIRDCLGWTDDTAASTGWSGDPSATDANWTDTGISGFVGCSTPRTLYCFEQ